MEAGAHSTYGRNSIYSAPFLPATVWQCGLCIARSNRFFFFLKISLKSRFCESF